MRLPPACQGGDEPEAGGGASQLRRSPGLARSCPSDLQKHAPSLGPVLSLRSPELPDLRSSAALLPRDRLSLLVATIDFAPGPMLLLTSGTPRVLIDYSFPPAVFGLRPLATLADFQASEKEPLLGAGCWAPRADDWELGGPAAAVPKSEPQGQAPEPDPRRGKKGEVSRSAVGGTQRGKLRADPAGGQQSGSRRSRGRPGDQKAGGIDPSVSRTGNGRGKPRSSAPGVTHTSTSGFGHGQTLLEAMSTFILPVRVKSISKVVNRAIPFFPESLYSYPLCIVPSSVLVDFFYTLAPCPLDASSEPVHLRYGRFLDIQAVIGVLNAERPSAQAHNVLRILRLWPIPTSSHVSRGGGSV